MSHIIVIRSVDFDLPRSTTSWTWPEPGGNARYRFPWKTIVESKEISMAEPQILLTGTHEGKD